MDPLPDDQLSAKSEDLAGSRVKFLCSYGGKILPRPQDGQLRYVGGETRMIAVHRTISYSELAAKLHNLFGPTLCFKYQLSNEDLDALISVTCDEDLENMIDEHDKNDVREGASRLRAFLFPAPCASGQDSREESRSAGKASKVSSDLISKGAFQVPDFLFGLDPGNRHERDQVFLPSHSSPSYRDPAFLSSTQRDASLASSFTSPDIVVSQAECSCQASTSMDSGMRGPAPHISALDPLMSNPLKGDHIWNTKKSGDVCYPVEQTGEQNEEKRPAERIGDTNYNLPQYRESNSESGLQKVPSKDRLTSHTLDESPPDTLLLRGRHRKIQQQPLYTPCLANMEKYNPEEVLMDAPRVFLDLRQENPVFAGGRSPKNAEIEWTTQQANFGAEGYEGTLELHLGSCRNSGDSDLLLYKRTDFQVVDSVPYKNIVTVDSPTEGFKYQDSPRVHDNMMSQQQKQGDFEAAYQINVPQHMHLATGHSQQIHSQAYDSQEQQQLPHDALGAGLMPPHTSHLLLPGATVYHHHLASAAVNTGGGVYRVDALPNSREPSPMYRQAGILTLMQPDSQQLLRAINPLHDKYNATVPHRYVVPVAQVHNIRGIHPTTIQQPSKFPISSPFMDFSEPHAINEQVHYPEKVSKGNNDTDIGQMQHPDKIVRASHDQALGQANFFDDNLNANTQYI